MPDEIVYPQGCRPVTEDLGADELIRRLKTLAHTLQAMGQDEGMYQQYIPLAIHLAEDHFLQYPSRDVQLLIACCIADVLRVYAPEAPYKDPEKVKTIFLFLIKQLGGLKDPKDPAFKRYFYLLENLAYVKSFNMCFELEDCQEIFCNLFGLMFKIVNDEHSGKVKSFMLDVLCPLITESDIVSNELLDIILMNIVEPNKSQKKNTYLLAKELVVKCSDTLEPYIQAFFNHVLILGKEEKGLGICSKVYDLIYELYKICPSVLLSVLPQLEVKLKSSQEIDRLGAVSLLARMFSEKYSTLAKTHPQLWRAFLGRFNDINMYIRIKCVQYSMHFLLNHPELRKDITDTLKMRQHDSEESVRYEVVMAIVSTAKRDSEVVSESEDLLEFVKERTLDKKFKIRKEAMSGLAMIYKKHLLDSDVPQATKKAVTWIKDKILHGYYMTSMEDRLLVERLVNTSLVPFTLGPEERMKKLYHLLGTVDDHATKAFIELQKAQMLVRRGVGEWIEMHKKPPSEEREKDLAAKVTTIAKFLPDQVKALEFLNKFSKHMLEDNALFMGMEAVVRSDISCKDCAETVSLILKKLGQPVMTNLYYNTIKMLLERVSSVMVDHEALKVLVGYVEDCLHGGNLIEEIGLHPNTAGERGLKLLVMLSYVFPCHFLYKDVIRHMISLFKVEGDIVVPLVLSALTFVGKHRPLSYGFREEMEELTPIIKTFAIEGTTKQAKQAIRCVYVNLVVPKDPLGSEIIEWILGKIKESLDPECPHYRTAIISLGHIAINIPNQYPVQIKNIVSRKIVKELLVKNIEVASPLPLNLPWCREDQLPDETRCKVEGLKMMARWLVGLRGDRVAAQKTFRMLTAFITNEGDLLQYGKLSKAEMAWLRLAAGCAMLKICEQKGVGDQYVVDQFYTLSTLVYDETPQVREQFLHKLFKGLIRGLPNKGLPLDFMGFYALVGMESNKKIKAMAKQHMLSNINKRKEYVKSLTMGVTMKMDKAMAQLPNILPDIMLVFSIPVLAHCSKFTSITDRNQLLMMRNCLWFVMEPLIHKNDFFSFGLYKEYLDRIKISRDSLLPNDEDFNQRMWALCDLATALLFQKASNFGLTDYPVEAKIPAMYFKKVSDPLFFNNRIYIPPEFQHKVTSINVSAPATVKRTRSKTENLVGKLQMMLQDFPIDTLPANASETQIVLSDLEEAHSEPESSEPQPKRNRFQETPSTS